MERKGGQVQEEWEKHHLAVREEMSTSIMPRRYWYFTPAYIYMELAAIPRRVRFDMTISTATTDHILPLSRFWKTQLVATFLYAGQA